MSSTRKSTDSVAEKVKSAARDWATVKSLRPFEVENFLAFLSILNVRELDARKFKRTARFNRQKAAHNLQRVLRAGEASGPMLVFLLSVSTAMTRLGKFHVDEFLRQMHQESLPYSPELESQVATLLRPFHRSVPSETSGDRVTGRDGTDAFNAPAGRDSGSEAFDDHDATPAGDSGSSDGIETIALSRHDATSPIDRYEIPLEYLAEFIRRLNGGSALEIIVRPNDPAEAPFIPLKRSPEARLYLNHAFSAVLLDRIVDAETKTREDGTIVLVGCKKSQ